MARTNVDIDEELCRRVMERDHLSTTREAFNFALRHVAGEPLGLDEARSMRGSGWDGDLHADTDYTALARHTDLRVHPASRS